MKATARRTDPAAVAHLGTVPLQPGVVHFRKILAVEEHLAFGGAMQAQDRLH
ncbi:MAG: hypothetical protein R2873_28240 [Caldilineaceae bacterium]